MDMRNKQASRPAMPPLPKQKDTGMGQKPTMGNPPPMERPTKGMPGGPALVRPSCPPRK